MIVRALIAVILALIVAWVAGLFLPDTISALIGLLVGLVYFFGDNWSWRA